MRVVVYASGSPLSESVFEAIAKCHDVALVVRPSARSPLGRARSAVRQILGRRDSLDERARSHGARVLGIPSARASSLEAALVEARADIAVIAAFPWIIPGSALRIPRFCTLNVHSSLLPRHRGPSPYFWTYYDNVPETGVTVHVAESRADEGDIVSQRVRKVPRGHSVTALHRELSTDAAAIIEGAIAHRSAGSPLIPQDPASATYARRVDARGKMVQFESWPVERVWHFLAGLYPHFTEALEHEGRAANYSAVREFRECNPLHPPGGMSRLGKELRLWCRDGYVSLEPSSA